MTAGTDADSLFVGGGELAALMRQTEWSKTPLGPISTWPNGLRAAVRIVLSSRFSMWMGWGDELTFLYNDAYRRDTLGAKHPRSLAMPTRELWHEIWDDIAGRIQQVLETGEATWDEQLLLILERNGYREETYHTFSYSPLFDDDAKIRGVLSVVTEQTAGVVSQRRVALLGKLGLEISGSNTDAAVLGGLERALASDSRDVPFTLTYLFDEDAQVARLASSTGAWGEGSVPPTLVMAPDMPWQLDQVLAGGQPRQLELAGTAWPSGPWASSPTHAYVIPLARQGQSRPAGALVCGLNPHRPFDATYREFLTLLCNQLASGLSAARAFELERRRAESLAELDRAKTAFFSNVSHEFRTPLTLMLGPLADIVADPDLDPPVRDEISTIHRNGLRLLKLVNTMLDFSRIEAGRTQAHFAPIDLAQLTGDLASVFRGATEKAGLELVVDCPPLDALVAVDPDMWEKIVLNLLSNAFKFTLHGRIAVRLARRADTIELAVQDSGCGIPADELPHVFERFHRVEGTRGRTFEGTGIGLALVQELVRLHDGSITVASVEGEGTTFTVTIPLRRAAASDALPAAAGERPTRDAFIAEALRWLPDEPAMVAVAPVSRERIVVADDNADMRAYMKRLLAVRWDVETVSNGREALESIRARRPDLVVTDVMMPELDGFELIAELRGDPSHVNVPVIMLSARAGEEARVEGLQAGASDYLVKPFASRELIARIEAVLRRAALREADELHAQRLTRIFEQAPAAMAVLRGPEHVYEVANSRYRTIVGGRDVIGRRIVDAVPEVVDQGVLALLDRVFASGEPFVANAFPFTFEHGTPRGTEQGQFDIIFQPLSDAEGVVYGVVVIAHDVTALATARKDAESANRTKDEFLAMLGHELRNPLAPIMTALDLMRLRNSGAERERAVIERQVQHLVGLVDDLLDISRITRGKIELNREQVELTQVVARSVELSSPLFDHQHHQLVVDVDPEIVIDGDRARLAQIFSNLLTNAAKYTPPGGRIELRGRRDGSDVVLTVKDNGIGIEVDMIGRVFEPFEQARQALDRSRGGLGLGLAIVANLTRLHGGQVSAVSEGAGRGSTFTVRLPVLVASAAQAPVQAAPPTTRGARVLIVDDNFDSAQMLAQLLESRGYEAVAAHDGPSALAVAAALRPQVAVLDLGLPVMDGYELARTMRGRPELAATKLVALTGYGQPADRARTAAEGFAAHFVKPVETEALRAAIEKLIGD